MTIQQEIGLFGLLALLMTTWDQVSAVLRWPRRWLVVCRRLDIDAVGPVLSYLAAHAKSRPGDSGWYRAERLHVRTLGRVALVFIETLYRSGRTYWLGWRPIWFSDREPSASGPTAHHLYYLRWSLNWETFLGDVAKWDDHERQQRGGHRFRIKHHGGTGYEKEKHEAEGFANATPGSPDDVTSPSSGYRLLHWSSADIGASATTQLDTLSLRPEQRALTVDVDRFVHARMQFEERAIPWRRGWMLWGKPGTGKTSIVRSIAIEHDLPIHVFDLGSMGNTYLHACWTSMLQDTPCIALIEDIDGVYGAADENGNFDTRALVSEGPTFDALLQAIGGISTIDGVLLFITTNRPDRVDAALRRGGRIDMEVEFLGLDYAGRFKMAKRILCDDTAAERAAVDSALIYQNGTSGEDVSPADYQERLCRIALAEMFPDVSGTS